VISINTTKNEDNRGHSFSNCHMFSRPQKSVYVRMWAFSNHLYQTRCSACIQV